MTFLPWLLVACWTPSETGPRSMIGNLLDHDGSALTSVTVQTVESSWITDGEGAFAVNYKEPSQFVHLTHEGIWFKRSYTPKDDNSDVQLILPERHVRRLQCETDAPCQLRLTWHVTPELDAVVNATCDPGKRDVDLTMPSLQPPAIATCRVGASGPTNNLHAWSTEDGLRLTPPPVPVEILLVASGRDVLPNDCELFAGDATIESLAPGHFIAHIFGRTTFTGQCEGVPITPRTVMARTPAELTLTWSPDAPTFDPIEFAPWAQEVTVLSFHGKSVLWTLPIPAMDDGTFQLPPLPAGRYALAVGSVWETIASLNPAEELLPEIAHLITLPYLDDNNQNYVVGLLHTERQLNAGPLQVKLHVPDGLESAPVETPTVP